MEEVIIIEDETLGILNGRDCIYIDTVTQDEMNNLIIKGSINGNLARKINEDKWIPYNLIFHCVIAYFSCEIDTYENIDTYNHLDCSDFNWVKNSQWLATFPIRKDFEKSIYKHYQVFTYDYVFNIVAVSYELNCDLANVQSMNKIPV